MCCASVPPRGSTSSANSQNTRTRARSVTQQTGRPCRIAQRPSAASARQMDPGAQATLGGRLKSDVAAMAARDVAGDRQTETDASGGRVARRLEAHEWPEHAAPVCGRNSRAVVIDED